MKKTFPILVLFLGLCTNAQEYKLEEKSITCVFEVAGKSKSEIFAAILKWVTINYSSKNVIQLKDLESGNIVIKGTSWTAIKNNVDILISDESYPKQAPLNLNHLIEINVKENKFRIIYTLTDVKSKYDIYNNINLKCINFVNIDDNNINEYNKVNADALNSKSINEVNREKYKSLANSRLIELSNNIVSDIKSVMKLIENAVITSSGSGW